MLYKSIRKFAARVVGLIYFTSKRLSWIIHHIGNNEEIPLAKQISHQLVIRDARGFLRVFSLFTK